MIDPILILGFWPLTFIWAFGCGLTFLLGIMIGWLNTVSSSEALFRILFWPLLVFLMVIVGFFTTIRTLCRM